MNTIRNAEPIEGFSHWCEGKTLLRRKCRNVVSNGSDRCAAGHKNQILISTVPVNRSDASISEAETERTSFDIDDMFQSTNPRIQDWKPVGDMPWPMWVGTDGVSEYCIVDAGGTFNLFGGPDVHAPLLAVRVSSLDRVKQEAERLSELAEQWGPGAGVMTTQYEAGNKVRVVGDIPYENDDDVVIEPGTNGTILGRSYAIGHSYDVEFDTPSGKIECIINAADLGTAPIDGEAKGRHDVRIRFEEQLFGTPHLVRALNLTSVPDVENPASPQGEPGTTVGESAKLAEQLIRSAPPETAAIFRTRDAVAEDWCRTHNRNRDDLTLDEIFAIRALPEWQNAGK
jgi:hypothetical protein